MKPVQFNADKLNKHAYLVQRKTTNKKENRTKEMYMYLLLLLYLVAHTHIQKTETH